MPRTNLGHRPDANHKEIKEDLLAAGYTVLDTSAVGMSLDLIVIKHGIVLFVEIKNPNKLTKAQMGNLLLSLTEKESRMTHDLIRNGGNYIIVTDSQQVMDEVKRQRDSRHKEK